MLWDLEKKSFTNIINTPGVELGPTAVFARKRWVLATARMDVIDFYLDPSTEKRGPQWNPRKEARCIDLSPDGRLIAAAFSDGIHLYNTETGMPHGKKLDRHQGPVAAVMFTADGRYLVSGGAYDSSVRFWEVPA
jgi:WD40 repeat protein